MALSTGMGKYTFSRVEIKHREHKGMGYDEGYSTVGVFACPNTNTIGLPFVDAKLHVFNNAYLASNVGLGCRFSNSEESLVFGMNAYYDFRNFKSFSSHQGAGGVEFLGRYLSLRLNGYYPFSGKFQEDDIHFREFQGNSALVQQKIRYALPSADGELGFTLPPPFEQLGLYVGVGGYYLFKQKGFFGFQNVGNVPGARARLRASPTQWFSIGVEYTYDKLFKGRINGFASFNIPLGPRRLKGSTKSRFPYQKSESDNYLEWMNVKTQDVIRNEIIPIYRKSHRFPHLDEFGNSYHFTFVNNTGTAHIGQGDTPGTGSGTFEDPYTTIRLADLNAPEDGVVYVFFGDGTSRNYDEGYGFKSGQVMSSSGLDLTLNGVIIPPFTPGELAKITNTGNPVFLAQLAREITINGFVIDATDSAAIAVQSTAVNIRGNQITGGSNLFNVVDLDDPVGNNYIIDNVIIGAGSSTTDPAVVSMENAVNNYTNVNMIKGNTVEARNGQDAFQLLNLYDSTFIINNDVSSNSNLGHAFDISQDDTITGNNGGTYSLRNNTVTTGFNKAVFFDWASSHRNSLKVRENTFTGANLATAVGYENSSDNGNLIIAGNTFTTSGSSISLSNFTAADKINGVISGNTISVSSGSDAIQSVTTGSVNLDIEQNTITYPLPQAGQYSGINYRNTSTGTLNVSNLTIRKNTIFLNSSGGGAFDITVANSSDLNNPDNNVDSVLHCTIDNNDCRQMLVSQGGSEPLCLTLTRNLDPINFKLERISGAKGGFGVFSQSSTDFTTQGLIKKASQPNGNNPDAAYNLIGDVTIAPPGSGCPELQAVYVDSATPYSTSQQNGSFWFPYKTMPQAQATSSEGDLIYVYGRGDVYDTGTAGYSIKINQLLVGSSVDLNYKGHNITPKTNQKPIVASTHPGGIIFTNSDTSSASDYFVGGFSFIPQPTLTESGSVIFFTHAGGSEMTTYITENEILMNNKNKAQTGISINSDSGSGWSHTIINNSIAAESSDPSTGQASIGINLNCPDPGVEGQLLTIQDNSIIPVTSHGINLDLDGGGTINIVNNTIKSTSSNDEQAILLGLDAASKTLETTVSNNKILQSSFAVEARFSGNNATHNVVFDNNSFVGFALIPGIELFGNNATMHFQGTNNTSIGRQESTVPDFGFESSGTGATLCIDTFTNNSSKLFSFETENGGIIKIATGSESGLKTSNSPNATVKYTPTNALNNSVFYTPVGSTCP